MYKDIIKFDTVTVRFVHYTLPSTSGYFQTYMTDLLAESRICMQKTSKQTGS